MGKEMKIEEVREIRFFDTGATRNTDKNKLDFEGFLSPLVLERFAKYMHENRIQSDGRIQDSDNWQKGIPISSYMKSKWRHFMDIWKEYRGIKTPDGMQKSLCADMFNTMGMLHEVLKEEKPKTKTLWQKIKNLLKRKV